MARNIVFYPTLDKKQVSLLGCQLQSLKASYLSNGSTEFLRCSAEEDTGIKYISIIDDAGRWSPDKYSLSLEGVLAINNLHSLFGSDGVISDDGVLGIGLVWKSKTSNQRGSKQICVFDKSTENEKTYSFDLSFDAAYMRGAIELSFQLIVVRDGSADRKLSPGLLLGELESMIVILEGINSVFTVFEKSAPGETLWTVSCDWDDPEYDPFSECVRVTINTAHPAWQLTSDEDVRKELLKEIMASSMQVVISELSAEQVDGSIEYAPGSVCDAIAYIVGRADLDMQSNATIARSIREYLDKSMK